MKWNERSVPQGQQLELTLGATAVGPAPVLRRLSAERATWWFDHIQTRLRNVWRPAPPARPEQVGLFSPPDPTARWRQPAGR